MKYDDVVNKAREVRAPREKTTSDNDKSNTKMTKQTIDQVKEFDKKHRYTMRITQVLYSLFVVFAVSMILIEDEVNKIIAYAIITAGLILVIYLKHLQLKMNSVSHADVQKNQQ